MISVPTWINNHIHYKVLYEIKQPFPNFNGAAIEVWEWISDYILHFSGQGITGIKLIHVNKIDQLGLKFIKVGKRVPDISVTCPKIVCTNSDLRYKGQEMAVDSFQQKLF